MLIDWYEMVILEVLLVVHWGLRMVSVGGRISTRRLMLLLRRISKVKLQWVVARYVPRINRTSPGITTGSEEAMSMTKSSQGMIL
jgi:hypothetical protein